MQRILYATFPNTQPIALWQTLVLVLGEVRRSKPDQKSLREFLRLRNLYDKETFPILAEFIDLRLGDPCTLGPVADRLLDAADEAAARDVIAARLIEQNPLLAKYCLEALDAEHGGRLHSTNELYRMITSYVYPGEKPTLLSFKAWVDWAVAASLLNLVGIRWALGNKGLEVLPRLRAIDAEEFLEEERAAGAQESAPEEAEPPEAQPAPAAPVEQPVAPEPPEEAAEPRGAPPEPAQVQPAQAQPAQVQPAQVQPAPAPRPVGRVVRPIAAAVERPFIPRPVGPEELAADRDALLAWYEQYPGRRPICAAMVGVDVTQKTPSRLLELAFGALLLAKGVPPATAQAAMDVFRSSGVLLAVGKGRFPSDQLASLLVRNPDPGFAMACEATVHLPRIMAATADPAALTRPEDQRELLWGLWRRLYEPVAPLAPFMLAKFLCEAGMLRVEAACVVPTFTVRENAFRIGFLDRIHAGSFSDLLEASLSLTASFGYPALEGPLSQVHEAYGCSFRCGRAAVCPLACREKGEIAPVI